MKTEQQIRDEAEHTKMRILELQDENFYDPVYPTSDDKNMLLIANKRQLKTLLWVLEEDAKLPF